MPGLAPKLATTAALLAFFLAVPVGASAAPGDLDPSFGNGGLRILDESTGTGEYLYDVLVLPDGRILAVGERGSAGGFLLTRLDANGALDTSFGDAGFSLFPYTGLDGQTRSIDRLDVQSDGKIVAAGLGHQGGTDAGAIARFTPDGSALDPAFNGGEPLIFRTSNQPTDPSDVAAAPGVKVVVVGTTVTPMGSRMFVVRRTGTGSPDVGFNFSGERVVDVPGSSFTGGDSAAVLPDGSMLVGGSADQGLLVVKLTDGGQPDAGFGTAGIATHDVGADATPSGEALDIKVLPEGRILTTGSSNSAVPNDDQFFLARLTPQGDLDPSFGTGGVVTRNPSGLRDEGTDIEVLPDGKILVAGYRGSSNVSDSWIQRFTPDGQPDPTFGSNGEAVLAASPAEDEFYGLSVDAFGRAIAVGGAADGTTKLLLARFLGDPDEPPAQSVLDPDLRELELVGRRLTPFDVSCFAACAAQVDLRSRNRLRLPHGSTHRRAVVSIGSAALPGGTAGRRTVRLAASRRARAILKRRRIAARLGVSIEGGETLTRNVTVRAAQRTLKLNRRGRGRLRVTFQAEADPAQGATLTLRLGGSVAARKRVAPRPGRSRVVSLRLSQRALGRIPAGGSRTLRLTLRYRLDTGAQVSQSRGLRVRRKR